MPQGRTRPSAVGPSWMRLPSSQGEGPTYGITCGSFVCAGGGAVLVNQWSTKRTCPAASAGEGACIGASTITAASPAEVRQRCQLEFRERLPEGREAAAAVGAAAAATRRAALVGAACCAARSAGLFL
jgi:hypothetical protein